jgi:sporulation protein YlmC with PRC-barrel domain
VSDTEPQVSWKAIDSNAVVVTANGHEIGRVKEVAGDENADIFDGLVVSPVGHGDPRFVPAERVTRISPDRVETDLGADQAASLPPYTEPVSVTWRASGSGRFGDRLRTAFNDLFGRRPRGR